MKSFARLLVCLPMLWVEVAFAADCTSNSYRLRTQEEVDSLGATACDTILGSLTIESRPESDITNIDALSNLTSIGGDLVIEENNALQNLDGLVNLSSVPGRLYISSNDALRNIDGLGNLTSVGSDLFLSQNSALVNLDGLGKLISVGGYLSISDNNSLTNIDGLANLTSVGSALSIGRNGALENLDGLTSITSLVESLSVYHNDALTNIDGLGNLANIGRTLSITNNNALTNIDGLWKLTSVGGWLIIEENDALTNINGLSKLGTMGGDRLEIRGNDSLRNVDGLVGITNLTGEVHIRENDALMNIDGLSNLTSVRRGSLSIYENPSLSNVNGLAKLTSVQNSLRIKENLALTNIDALSNLTSVGSDLTILFNNALANCQGLAPVLGWPSGPPEDDVGGDIEISGNSPGCTSVQQVLESVSGPTKPVINQAVISNNTISLIFTPSSFADTPFVATGYTASCTGADIDISASPAIDLLDNSLVQETLTVSGYDPSTVLSAIEVDINITHSDPTDLYITLTSPQGTEIILWNQGSTGGEDMVGTFPTTLTAVGSFDGITGQAMDGDWVLSIEDIQVGPIVREGVLNSWGMRITEELSGDGAGSPIELDGATQGRDYVCSVTPVTQLGAYPVSDPFIVSETLESDPPILESFTVAPNEVNVSTEAQIVTFTVEASDESQIDWAISEIALESPSNVVHILPLSSTSPHTASFEIGCDSAQGLWRVRYVGLFDEHRNYKEYDANELTETEITVEFIDTDLDSIDDCYDSDDDNDGVEDSEDEFPLDASESVDTDNDGIGNNADTDDDGDGVADEEDAFPLDPTKSTDTSAPILNSISINKLIIDVSEEPQTLIATVDASDESGIDWGYFDTRLVFRDSGGTFKSLRGSNENPGELRLDITSDDVGGTWGLQWLNLVDIHGNKANIRNLSDYGLPSYVTIVGGKENDPPTLNSISINKITIDVRQEAQTIIATVDASDESGIDWGYFDTRLVFRDQEGNFHSLNGSNENPGELRLDITSDDVGGTWGLQWLNLVDIHGNKANIRDLGEYGLPSSIYVLITDEPTSDISLTYTGLYPTLGENYGYEMFITAENLASEATSPLDLTISTGNVRVTSVKREDGSQACSITSTNYDSSVSCSTSPIAANSSVIFKVAVTAGEIGSSWLNLKIIGDKPDISMLDNYIYVASTIEAYVDSDNDGISDQLDAFPLDPEETTDNDADGIGDNADTDDDNDGVDDSSDAFPLDVNESVDTDGDGVGNNADTDDDGDGYSDSDELSVGTNPLDANSYPEITEAATQGLPIWLYYIVTQPEASSKPAP